MKVKKVWAVYFSPTGGTKRVVRMIADMLGQTLQTEIEEVDFTGRQSRGQIYAFNEGDLVVLGSPVYAGRIPNKILPDYENCFAGNGAWGISISVYGNRSYGDALTEMRLLMQRNGFRIIGAAAVVSRHAFSDKLAAGRPDAEDQREMCDFVSCMAEKLQGKASVNTISLPKTQQIAPYYIPLQENGEPAKFLKAKPLTDVERCSQCKACVKVCPMGSIEASDVTDVSGVCIKCQACVVKCPNQAKYFADEQFLSHVKMLEKNYTQRAENDFYV